MTINIGLESAYEAIINRIHKNSIQGLATILGCNQHMASIHIKKIQVYNAWLQPLSPFSYFTKNN
jgi:hypothetical protein